LHGIEKDPARVLHQVPAIGHLCRVGQRPGDGRAVAAAAVTGDNLDPGTIGQPGLDGGGLAVGKDINDPMPLEVADNRSVAMPALPRPVVDADNPRCRLRDHRPGANHPQQGVLAHRHQQPPGEALAGASAECEAEMMDDALQPRRPTGEGLHEWRRRTARRRSSSRNRAHGIETAARSA
jgi:hypothetical protein